MDYEVFKKIIADCKEQCDTNYQKYSSNPYYTFGWRDHVKCHHDCQALYKKYVSGFGK